MKPSLPILLLALAAGCAGRRPAPSTTAAQAPVEPVQYTYVVKASYPHLTTSYTQGLYFDDGFLWEGTGQYGASAIQRLDLPTGRADVLIWEVDPATFRRGRKITVTAAGRPVQFLNELEWIEGKIWANVYTTDQIVIIDPATGTVEGVVDLAGLLPEEEITPATDVLNGIAYDAATRRIFVTGKNWSRLFEIEIVKK